MIVLHSSEKQKFTETVLDTCANAYQLQPKVQRFIWGSFDSLSTINIPINFRSEIILMTLKWL